jgi:hypothetical protein
MNTLILRIFTGLLVLCLLVPAVHALTAADAKQDWLEAKQASLDAQVAHKEAKIDWAADKTDENNQRVIDTGKDSLHAALDEVEAWLVWKQLEVEENPSIPADLRTSIGDDVDANLAKIDGLRDDVDAIETRLDLGITFLRMVGEYLELLTDVARDSGFVWVHVAQTYADTADGYEEKLRSAAEGMPDNAAIIEKLDRARDDIDGAYENIENARDEYEQVVLPGKPLLRFSNGNNYLRIARGDLLSAHGSMNQAYALMVAQG